MTNGHIGLRASSVMLAAAALLGTAWAGDDLAARLARAALDSAEAIGPPVERARWVGEAAGSLCGTDRQAAREAVSRVEADSLRGWHDEALEALAPGIAEGDPEWAGKLVSFIADVEVRERAEAAALGRIGDPGRAAEWSRRIRDPSRRAAGLASAARLPSRSQEALASLALGAIGEIPSADVRLRVLVMLAPAGLEHGGVREAWTFAFTRDLPSLADDQARYELTREASKGLAHGGPGAQQTLANLVQRFAESEDFAVLAGLAAEPEAAVSDELLHSATTKTLDRGADALRLVGEGLLDACDRSGTERARRCTALLIGGARQVDDEVERVRLLARAAPILAQWDPRAAVILARGLPHDSVRDAALLEIVRRVTERSPEELARAAKEILSSPVRARALGILAARTGDWQAPEKLDQPLRDAALAEAALTQCDMDREDIGKTLLAIQDADARSLAALACVRRLAEESPGRAAKLVPLMGDSEFRAIAVAELTPVLARMDAQAASQLALSVPMSQPPSRVQALIAASRAARSPLPSP